MTSYAYKTQAPEREERLNAHLEHTARVQTLLEQPTHAKDDYATRSWRTRYFLDGELVTAELIQVLRVLPGMPPNQPRVIINLQRGFQEHIGDASQSCFRPGTVPIPTEDIVCFLRLNEVPVGDVEWREVKRHGAEDLLIASGPFVADGRTHD